MFTVDINKMLTIPQAAKRFGVCNQRMHQLIRTYGVETFDIHARLKMVTLEELAKIPAKRPDGVHIEKR